MGMMTRRNVKQRAVKNTAPVSKEKLDDFSQYMNEPEITEDNAELKYTKTEINRMPVAELREMAMKTGVEGADTWTGAELKEYLISILGL